LKESNSIQNMAVARELTKNFEQVIRGTPSEILDQLADFPLKGELVLILRTKAKELTQDEIDAHLIRALENQGVKGAVQDVTALTGISKKQLYQRALELK